MSGLLHSQRTSHELYLYYTQLPMNCCSLHPYFEFSHGSTKPIFPCKYFIYNSYDRSSYYITNFILKRQNRKWETDVLKRMRLKLLGLVKDSKNLYSMNWYTLLHVIILVIDKQWTRYTEKKYPFAIHISIIADGTSVSTFLCTWKLGPEEVSITAV